MNKLDKLVESIEDALGNWLREDIAERIASYLLTYGKVIVPSVSLMQKVYVLDGDKICFGMVDGLAYHPSEEWIYVKYTHPTKGERAMTGIKHEMLGKRIFLTKEDAEKALKSATDTNVGSKGVE